MEGISIVLLLKSALSNTNCEKALGKTLRAGRNAQVSSKSDTLLYDAENPKDERTSHFLFAASNNFRFDLQIFSDSNT